MMKFASAVIACLLLVAPAFAGRDLQQTELTSCTAFTAVSIVVKHGSCTGRAKADCKAFARAQEVILNAGAAAATTDLCDPVAVSASAEAVATAVASVFTSALAKVSCNGQGFGCGIGVANGDALATAYAEAFASAFAEAWNGDLSAVCIADIRAIAVAIVRAASKSAAKACVDGSGSALSFQSNFQLAVSNAIATAVADATAEVCNVPKHTSSCSSGVEGSSSAPGFTLGVPTSVLPPTTGTGTNFGFNFGSTVNGQVKFCEAPQDDCCFDSRKCAGLGLQVGPAVSGAGAKALFPTFGRTPVCFCHNG